MFMKIGSFDSSQYESVNLQNFNYQWELKIFPNSTFYVVNGKGFGNF